jgi:hypothetical protein
MHALLDAQTALIARGKTVALAGPRPLVARVLQLTGVDQRIPVYEHMKEAVAGWVALPELAAAARRGGRTVVSRSAPGLVHMDRA